MMLSERVVHAEVRELLMSGRPFQYAHLIKFERPSRPDALSGRASTSAQRYTYLTDASRDVNFDDLSKDLDGNPNGTQIYIANKVLGVTNIQESKDAKADNCSLTLDGNGIGGAVSGAVTITAGPAGFWDIQWPSTISLVHEGFREGDKITLSGGRVGQFNIDTFRANNITRVKKIDENLTIGTTTVTCTLDSEEVKAILLDKNSANYSSFINREVFIYRAYFEDGQLVGETPDTNGNTGPVLLFKGIINNVSFDDTDNGIKVQWGLTSHWGDFSSVRGRVTSDDFHRALDANGIPQPEAAIKPIYAYDKGFMHSDTSLNMLATYTVMVDKTTIKAKKGFFGIGAKTKVKTVQVAEGRDTPLSIQLQAKNLPVVYGVRTLEGIPVFADTLNSNSSEVYLAYALSEGEIGGLYDLYIEGKSLICNNKEDFDARSKQTAEETIDLVCRGRADRGDVLGGTTALSPTYVPFYEDELLEKLLRQIWNRSPEVNYQPYVGAQDAPADPTGAGIIHGESLKLTSPQAIEVDFFGGKEWQSAASQLVQIAAAKNFKVQNDYWLGGDNSEYWGPNHRLADTAYVVLKVTIKEGETTVPDIQYVVRGKVLDCYNYDYSYAHDTSDPAENAVNFNLGDMVTLSTGQEVQIIDKWSFARPDGLVETRFRFSEIPDLGYDDDMVTPSVTKFTMAKGLHVWTMTTWNHVIHEGSVGAAIEAPATITTPSPGNTTITYPPTPGLVGGGKPGNSSPIYSIIDNGRVVENALLQADTLSETSLVTRMLY